MYFYRMMIAAVILWAAGPLAADEYLNARTDLKLGNGNDTVLLQQALRDGKRSIYFPAGNYTLGTVELPDHTALLFDAKATVSPDADKLQKFQSLEDDNVTALFFLKGNHITLEGMDASSVFQSFDSQGNLTVTYLAYGVGCRDLNFRKLNIDFPPKTDKTPVWEVRNKVPNGILLDNCADILLTGSRIRGINHGLQTYFGSNVVVSNNIGFNSSTIVHFGYGSRGLKYYGNWSRKLRYPCIFRGGSPDPSRMAAIPQGSSMTVLRLLPYDKRDLAGVRQNLLETGWPKVIADEKSELCHLFGVYDIQITNNYAEYGRTLTWGNRARQVVIANNISRFMNDYSYGVEGCENIVFANNISINARSYSIMAMYWGDKVTVTGNQCIVRNEPFEPQYSDFPEQSAYWGGLLRFHHGPESAGDRAAGSRYGSGNVLISGNLLINELNDRLRAVVLDENQRDITISGNKLINCDIYKKRGAGAVKILGNDFTSTLPLPHPMVLFRGDGELIVKDNVMRYLGGAGKLDLAENNYKTQDEAQNAIAEERLAEEYPAIIAGNRWMNPTRVIIDNNIISGWTKDAVSLGSGSRPAVCQSVIRNNLVSGAIRLNGTGKDFTGHYSGNLNLDTMQPVGTETSPWPPEPKKE